MDDAMRCPFILARQARENTKIQMFNDLEITMIPFQYAVPCSYVHVYLLEIVRQCVYVSECDHVCVCVCILYIQRVI